MSDHSTVKDCVAVITGAASGLGRCFAVACARRGYLLLLADRDKQGLTKLAGELSGEYQTTVNTIAGDLCDQEVRSKLLGAAESGKPVGLWINNAGVSAKGPAKDMDPDRAAMVAHLNVTALTDLATRSIPLLLKSSKAQMINVSSLGAWYPIPYMAAYAASKSYILHFSMALNQELAGTGVTVSALCPGGMRTNELTIRDLDGQGLCGRLTIHSPESVVELALDRSADGKGVIIPGRWNNFLRILGALLPKTILAKNLEKRWRRSLIAMGLMKKPDATGPEGSDQTADQDYA